MSVPEKWKKYCLLAEYGFTTEDELTSMIVRLPWASRHSLASRLRSILADRPETLIVVKLVPAHMGRQLPNFRVTNVSDVDGLPEFLFNAARHFTEVWYCETNIGNDVFSVAGRIRVSPESHVIEQVWRCSPRMLESWGHSFEWPYARATRRGWGWRWKVAEIYSPVNGRETLQTLRAQFESSLRLLHMMRDRIEWFSEAIEDCGLNVYSLEYKIVGTKLTIIDWDTSNDRRVLDAHQ